MRIWNVWRAAALSAVFVGWAQAAPFIDPLSDTSNLSGAFGGTTAASDGNTVTITRNAGGDAGIDWRPAGTGFFDTDADQWLVQVVPVGGGSPGDFYDIDVLFFTAASDGAFSSEADWVSSNSVALQSVDVRTLSGATEFFYLRFRIQPAEAGPSFTFDQFSAIPEPALGSLALAALCTGAALARPRQACRGL